MMISEAAPKDQPHNAMHFPSLLVGITIMLAGTVYPLLFERQDGSADHGLAVALSWAMSVGLVRGVGFVPRAPGWKLIFSAWSCGAGLLLAAWVRWWA